MRKNNTEKKYEIVINFLHQDASLQLSWAKKKEVAVWAATIFYVGVIYMLIQTFWIRNNFTEFGVSWIYVILFDFLFLIAITYFIWSNFNLIYNSNAYYLSVKKNYF